MQPGCDCGSGTGSSEFEGKEIEVLTTPSSFHTWLKHKNILTSLTKSFIGIFFGICNRSLMSDIMVIVSAKREGEGEREGYIQFQLTGATSQLFDHSRP